MAAYSTGVRICILNRWKTVNGWGFSLHSALKRHGARYIASVQPYSPAACTGLCPGDRIVEVNYKNICHAEHDEVVSIINSCEDTMMLLVVDAQTDIAYQNMQQCIHSHLPDILLLTCPKTEPERDADGNNKFPLEASSGVDDMSSAMSFSSTSGEYVVSHAAHGDVDNCTSDDSCIDHRRSCELLTCSSTSGEYFVHDNLHCDVDTSVSCDSSSVCDTSSESLTSGYTSGEYYVQTGRLQVRSHASAWHSKTTVRRRRSGHGSCSSWAPKEPQASPQSSPFKKHNSISLSDTDADLMTRVVASEQPAGSEVNETGVAGGHDAFDGSGMFHRSDRRRRAFRRRKANV